MICFGTKATLGGAGRTSSSANLLAKQKSTRETSIVGEHGSLQDTFSVEEYEQLVKNFYEQNKKHLKEQTPDVREKTIVPEGQTSDIREKIIVPGVELYRIGKLLRFKEYKIKGRERSEGIPTIDLSWPNMRDVFLAKVGKITSGRAGRLNVVISAIEGVEHDNFSQKLEEKQIQDQIKEIIALCLDKKEGLFDLRELNDANSIRFKEHLEQMLGDYTGFQRIMSLLAVSTLNSTMEHAFVPGFTKIGVAKIGGCDTSGNCYIHISRKIKIEQKNFDGKEYITDDDGVTYPTIFHEITHAYHHMVLGSLDLSDCESAYSILNSTDVDFIGLFFPMLSNEKIELATDKIVGLMTGKWDIKVIKSHIADGSSKEIMNIFKKVVDCGFGNLVFSKEDLILKKDNCVKIEEILTENMLAKAIYVYCCAIVDGIGKARPIWSNCEEMLTITGLAPTTDGHKMYLIEDRQHEEIHKIRHQENTETYDKLSDFEKHAELGKHFRYHATFKAEEVAKIIAYKIALICRELDDPPLLNTEDIKKISTGDISKIFSEIATKTAPSSENKIEDINIKTLLKPDTLRFSSDNTATKDVKNIDEFLKKAFEDIETSNSFNKLHIAVLNRDVRNIDILSKNAAYLKVPCDETGETLLHSKATCETGETPLHCAALNGDVNAIRILLYHGADPNAKNKKNETPLLFAAKSGNAKAIKALCECALTNPNTPSKEGETPLHLAAEFGNIDAINDLLELGANPNAKNKKDKTPLHLAAQSGDIDVIGALWKCPQTEAENKSVALHFAVKSGNIDTINALLKLGADPNAKNEKDETPLHLAALSGDIDVIEALWKCPQTEAENKSVALHFAVKSGNIDTINALFGLGADTKGMNKNKETSLHWAIKPRSSYDLLLFGWKPIDIEVIKTLLKHNADPNAKNEKDETPLHLAAESGNAEVINALLDREANPNAKMAGKDFLTAGSTPLHLAVRSGKAEAVNALLDHIKDKESALKAVNNIGDTPLHLAMVKMSAEVISAMLEYIKDKESALKAVNNIGYTPLHFAVVSGNAGAINTLLKYNANVGSTLLHFAAKSGKAEAVNALLDHIKDKESALKAVDNSGKTPLHLAAESGNAGAINTLLKYKANPNAKVIGGYYADAGSTPLHLAAKSGKAEAVNALLDHIKDKESALNTVDGLGYTPLHLAAESYTSAEAVINVLLDNGANPNAQGGYYASETPLNLAAKRYEGAKEVNALLASSKIKITFDTVIHCGSNDPEIKEMLRNKIKELLNTPEITIDTVFNYYSNDPEIRKMLQDKVVELTEDEMVAYQELVEKFFKWKPIECVDNEGGKIAIARLKLIASDILELEYDAKELLELCNFYEKCKNNVAKDKNEFIVDDKCRAIVGSMPSKVQEDFGKLLDCKMPSRRHYGGWGNEDDYWNADKEKVKSLDIADSINYLKGATQQIVEFCEHYDQNKVTYKLKEARALYGELSTLIKDNNLSKLLVKIHEERLHSRGAWETAIFKEP
ncbi:hypothetical protein FACS1894122_10150 [Alphaproteobacteria bacterium]|nr:hypothetical protein FACS1894122_10150 [Alphaproteobacteria bacterium]